MNARWRSKLLACLFGFLTGGSLMVSAQIPGPIFLRGTGGSVQQVDIPVLGTGGDSIQTVNVPAVGTCSNCITYAKDGYVIHAFTATGSTHTFTPPAGLNSVDVLIVAGGGGGGGDQYGAGGGGAGGLRWITGQAVTPSTPVDVVVGAGGNGGAASNGKGADGSNSSFGAQVALGGGGGGAGNQGNNSATGEGNDGGSGGGGGARDTNSGSTPSGGTGTGGQGNDGGDGTRSATNNNNRGGGGGGAGADGDTGVAGTGGTARGGNGGAGQDFSATFGTHVGDAGWFAGGGGGGKRTGGTGGIYGTSGGIGGQGGGGAGGSNTAGAGVAGVANTGGGGGGSGGATDAAGGAGGSGIVLVRYTPPSSGQQRVVHTFTSGGTFTPPAGLTAVDVLVVAGGGGGGRGGSGISGGGGGGGGVVSSTNVAVTPNVGITVTVGGGGAGATVNLAVGSTGGNSVFNSSVPQTANGGGGGGGGDDNGVAGGSGGGAGANNTTSRTGGTGSQGSAGGNNFPNGTAALRAAGGGGGGSGAGVAGSQRQGGIGGYGFFSVISGTPTSYAGGGGGAGGTLGGSGGAGGGGNGGAGDAGAVTAGTANLGGGGGGSGNINAGAGGSGVVIVSYVAPSTTYMVHTFTSSGTFTPPPGVSSVEVLVVGGGGGGGTSRAFGDAGAGGGGAGGVVYNNNFAVSGPVSVTVGAGGAGGAGAANITGTNGSDSVFGTLTALGGGGGIGGNGQGNSGGSGGGSRGANGGAATQPGSPSGGFGNAGGNAPGSPGGAPASGGGGAGAAGANIAGVDNEAGGAGGVGLQYNLTGTPTFYAGGGGGGAAQNSAAVGAGGQGGGGAGGRTDTPATAGTANTGGGGGGGNNDVNGADGGSGVVIVRYRPPTMEITQQPSASALSSYAITPNQPYVRIRDYQGTAISGINVTAAVDFGSATLGGTTTVATNGSGVAEFSNLTLTGSAGTIRLGFTAANSDPAYKVVSNNIGLVGVHLEITHATSYSVCSPSTPITVTVRDSNDNIITGFTGTVTLTNSSGQGTYSGSGVSNPSAGTAQYTFTGSENGVKVFNYSTTQTGTTTFDATSGVLETENYALSLDAGLCRIRISFPDAPATTCAAENVTFTVVNASGGTLTDFAGTLTLATNTGNGTWANGNGNGTFTPGPGNGTASYAFGSESSPGSVTLQLFHTNAGTVNVNASYGVYVDAPGFDPDLTVTACSDAPTLATQVCENDNSVDLTIGAQTTFSKRLVVVTVSRAGSLSGSGTPPATTQTLGGQNLTQVGTTGFINSGTVDVMTQIYAMTESTSPALPGAGTHTITVTSSGITRTCAFYFEGMGQTLPTAPATATATSGSSSTTITTDVTTPADNSYVFGVITHTNDLRTHNAPSAPFTELYDVNGTSSSHAVIGGVVEDAGVVGVTQTTNAQTDRRAHVVAAFRPAPPQLHHFRINHNGNGVTCSPNTVTITAVDQYGAVFTGYTGTVSITAGGAGSWGQGTATNAPTNGSPGAATYLFDAADNGVAALTYSNSSPGTVNFNLDDGGITELAFFDASLTLGSCFLRISHDASGSICTPEAVTITAVDANGNTLTYFTGTVDLSTVLVPGPGSAGGGWAKTDDVNAAQGTLTDVNPADGIASYQFVTGDAGTAVLNYTRTTTGTVNFNAVSGSVGVQSGYDPNLVIGNCYFRIDYPGGATGDVCTALQVRLTAVDNAGNTLTGYTGTVSLSTNTTKGNWVKPNAALGTLSDFGAGAGNYTFHDDDNGVVILHLFHDGTTASLNINASSGSFQEQVGYDPNATIEGCKFRVSLSSATSSTCTAVNVTLGVYDRNGNAAPDFAGQVTLNTTTGHGTWLSTTGNGTLVDTSPDNGTGTYTFVAADSHEVQLRFTDTTQEEVYITASAVGGAITVDDNYDPALSVGACTPQVDSYQCYQSNNVGSALTLPSSAETLGSRMVLMYIARESLDATPTPATSATFAGHVNNTALRYQSTSASPALALQVYTFLDADLPSSAGTYGASYAGSGAGSAMCLVLITGAAQQNPQTGTPPESGQLNGSNTNAGPAINTGITTIKFNSLVVSVAASGFNTGNITSSLANNMWTAQTAGDPTNADWKGSYEKHPVTSPLSVTEDPTSFGNTSLAHIVLALAPLVDGPPEVEGYVPVLLYKTLSGNVNYRAVGNTLRAADNSAACSMVNPAVGSTATVNLPSGSTIKNAYLYWAGSGGEDSGTNMVPDEEVFFGVDGDTPYNVIEEADEVFVVSQTINNPGPVLYEFFAAYKEVSGFIQTGTSVTYRFGGLNVDNGSPWAPANACVAGWALIVVYENANEDLNVINLFHGFQPFFHSSFTLIPRNFRMAPPDGMRVPHGQITHVTVEGDNVDGEGLNDAAEVFELQNDPDAQTFTALYNPPYNTSGGGFSRQYNDSISYPLYNYVPEPVFAGYDGSQNSYGFDIDTYHLEGDSPGDILYDFGNEAAEQITTRYGTGQDLVVLLGEFIVVTNSPIADLEVNLSSAGTFKVASTGTSTFTYEVINNGNGALSGGYASGDVILTGSMPAGLTINSISAPSWDCSVATSTAFTCVFEIADDWTTGLGAANNGQLAKDETLPDVVVTVNVANETTFPLLDNDISTVGRLSHVGNVTTCGTLTAGVQPDPTVCSKSPQFDNVNDLNKNLIDIDDIDEKQENNNNVDRLSRNVRGIETNLGITKTVVGVLETNEPAQYSLTVTNYGPDATTKTITVTDTLPSGLVPVSAVGTNWSCNIVGQDVTCTRNTSMALNATSTITLTTDDIAAPAIEGSYVTNSATVAVGSGNFDTTVGNNTGTNITLVTGPLAAGTEKYLLSVSADNTSIGGLGPFGDGDLVIYDPVAESATMFLAESDVQGSTSLGNVNALHLLPNGWVILSTSTPGSSINGVGFGPEDLVMYDPILGTATLIFDGSAIFTGAADIDAVHVVYNNSYNPQDWQIILSTADTATIGATTFQDNDIVRYTMNGGAVAILADGNDDDMFNGSTGDIGALYRRYDDANSYVLGTSDLDATIGVSGEQQAFERGELIEIDLTTANDPETTPLFCDDQDPCIGSPPGIFTPADTSRRLDAVHVVESGYFGHFAISSLGGDVCSATSITIKRHGGLGHTSETHYKGTILISNSLTQGTWAKDSSAKGTLVNISPGVARYTFADGPSGDQGEVILFITDTDASNTFNVNIRSNISTRTTVTLENSPTEDPNIQISELVTPITYLDQFESASYSANDGVASFKAPWSESGDDNNVSTGKIRITGGELRFNNLGGGTPSLTRAIDFSNYTVSDPPVLTFNWRVEGSPSGSFVIEAKGNENDASWTTLQTFTTPLSPTFGSVSYTLTQAPYNLVLSDATQIRLRVASGFSANANVFFFVDNLQVSTETNDCGVADAVDHYEIVHSGSMVSCQVELVTITPHTVGELDTGGVPGSIITLNTSTGKGTWGAPIGGTGSFSAVAGTGQATYTYQLGEGELVFPFNYTNPGSDPEAVTITVSDNNVPTKVQLENQTLNVARAGLRFYNLTTNSTNWPTLVAGIPSDTWPDNDLVVQAIQVSNNDPAVCVNVFEDGETVSVDLAFEMQGRMAYAPSYPEVVVNGQGILPEEDNNASGVNATGFEAVPLEWEDIGGGVTVARLNLTYPDAGALQIHGRYNIPLREEEDGSAGFSGDYMVGSGAPNTNNANNYNFVVRPFGFDIDFDSDRATNGQDDDADSWAIDATGSAFETAGIGFNTTVRAIAWDGSDSYIFDGNGVLRPATTANLADNATTPSFGNETDAAQDNVTLSHTLVAPVAGETGVLNDRTFVDFVNGVQTHTMSFSEVGIIDLTATLDSGNYLGADLASSNTGDVISSIRNVGRFIPADFTVTAEMLTARPGFPPGTSDFTYMGEQFTALFTLTARNAQGDTTQNYEGAYAKLFNVTAPRMQFYAVQDVASAADVDYTSRLALAVGGTNPFPSNFQADWSNGVVTIDGNLIFNRQANSAPDGPFGPLQVAVTVNDLDGVLDVGRDVDLDECDPNCNDDPEDDAFLYNLIGEHEFRYGRLVLDNAYGSELPDLDGDNVARDLGMGLRIEYWDTDTQQWLVNEDDSLTWFDIEHLKPVTGTFEGGLDSGELAKSDGPEVNNGVSTLNEGQTLETTTTDLPFYFTAPGEGNEGSVLLEYDLSNATGAGLEFLRFDWRTTGDDDDDVGDGDYSDSPRALLEFGVYRSSNRIINWQELFIQEQP